GVAATGRCDAGADLPRCRPIAVGGRPILDHDIPQRATGREVISVILVMGALEAGDAARAVFDVESVVAERLADTQGRQDGQGDDARDDTSSGGNLVFHGSVGLKTAVAGKNGFLDQIAHPPMLADGVPRSSLETRVEVESDRTR